MHFLPQDKQDRLPGAPEINEERENGKSPCFLLQQCARAKRHSIVWHCYILRQSLAMVLNKSASGLLSAESPAAFQEMAVDRLGTKHTTKRHQHIYFKTLWVLLITMLWNVKGAEERSKTRTCLRQPLMQRLPHPHCRLRGRLREHCMASCLRATCRPSGGPKDFLGINWKRPFKGGVEIVVSLYQK